MGYMINSLGNVPVDPRITLYIFVVNGDFRGRHFEALERHFAGIAEATGEHGAIARGFSRDFSDEVCRQFLGKSVDQVWKFLPALLITDSHPSAITERTMRLFVPLKRAEQEFGDLETFFRGLSEFARGRSPEFLRRFENRTDWFGATDKVIEVKPESLGISINVNELVRKIRERKAAAGEKTMANQFQYDVFLSHSSKDKAVVLPLAERLSGDGLRVWFDEWVLKPGDSIPAKIEEGLEHSRVLVLCMSANAFGSDWTQLEAGTFQFRDPLNKERRFIPLRLDAAPIKGSLTQFLYINWLPPDREQQYTKLLEACRNPKAWQHSAQSSESIDEIMPSRILIAGSSRYYGSDLTTDLFKETCQEVGRQLAKRGLHLVVGSWASDTADMAVLDSFVRNRGNQVTIAGIMEQPESWWRVKLGSDPKATFVQVIGSWNNTGRSVQVRESDAAFIIGGARGAIELSKIYVSTNQRIVATPQLGRAAKSIWDTSVRVRALAVSPDCVRRLESGTPSEVASAGLDLLSLL